MKLNLNTAWPFGLIVAAFSADQLSKGWILSAPVLNGPACLSDWRDCGQMDLPGPVNIIMAWNRGMSYSLFQSEGIMRWVLAAIMFIIALGFLIWLFRTEGRLLKTSLALVIGGAFGNLFDRVRFGAVVDFIDASALHFPYIFNVADTAISVGAVLLFTDQFLIPILRKSARPEKPKSIERSQ